MIRINLLPYRTERRQSQILQHIAILMGMILSISTVLFFVDLYKTSELTTLEDEFSSLKAQNDVLKKKIGKIRNLDKLRADVERKLALVDKLQEGRFNSLVSLNGLAEVIPENVWLTSITDSAGALAISGLGESNKAVANFMRALDQSPLFANINLKTIARTQAGNVPVRQFSLTLNRIIEQKEESAANKGSGA
ncbi:MAG: PilN domain-containing protein [Mariprofundaceae bacterium]